jgi:Bacterial protein of unknown function (DUF885)
MVAVGELADRYVEEMAALDPCAAAEMGVAGHDAELTDYGPDGVASRAALLRGTLSQLGPAPEATAAEPRLACKVAGQSFLDFEIDRYLGRPGQAISYKVGERVWLDVREAARRRRADGFDLRAFYAMALDMGPMGLDTLRERLVDGAGG